jgi:hypothetical protein
LLIRNYPQSKPRVLGQYACANTLNQEIVKAIANDHWTAFWPFTPIEFQLTFRFERDIVPSLKMEERVLDRNISRQFIAMTSKECSQFADGSQPEENGHRCSFGCHSGRSHGCWSHRGGCDFSRDGPPVPDVSDAEDENEESAKREKAITSSIPEDKKQLKRQFRKFVLSCRHGGRHTLPKKLFCRL